MEKSLYQVVYNVQQNTAQGKRRVGYTVGAYAGVLNALEAAEMITVDQMGEEIYDSNISTTNSETLVNGFFQNDKNQAEVTFNNYMSFVVDVLGEGGTSNEVVNVKTSICEHDGLSILGSNNIQFPPSDYTKEANESLKLGTGNFGGFVIGVGVSFDSLLLNYFKQFYGEMQWDAVKLEKLAGQGAIHAELFFPNGTGDAQVIHAKVTVKVTKNCDVGGYSVYVPTALMLLNKYKSIGQITVKVSDSKNGVKEQVVDGNNASFPFASNNYDVKKGIISGYKPEAMTSYVNSDSTTVVDYKSSTLTGKKGRVRFYFLKDFEQQVISEIGSIPESYKSNLFTGVLSQDGSYTITEETVVAGDATEADRQFHELISRELGGVITATQVGAAIAAQAKWESAGKWDLWEVCLRSSKKPNGDGEGVSAGKFQFTQRAGGIKKYKQQYLALGGQMSQEFSDAIDKSLSGSKRKLSFSEAYDLLKFKSEFQKQSETVIGQKAQCKVWENEKGAITYRAFKMLNCTTAAEFSSIFGAVNHWPAVESVYKTYKSLILSQTNIKDKVRIIEGCHWTATDKYGFKNNNPINPGSVTEQAIRNWKNTRGSSAANGWANRYADVMKKYNALM